MSRRKKNPSPLAVVATLAILGVGGYYAYEHMSKAQAKGKKAKTDGKSGAEPSFQPWVDVPAGSTLMDQGAFVSSSAGPIEWRIYQGPQQFVLLYRTAGGSLIEFVNSMAEAQDILRTFA